MRAHKSLLTLAILAIGGIAGAVSITNGDFEAGNTGFTSGYAYVAPTGNTVMYPQGVYTVATNPVDVHNLFASMGDHTSGSGNMMVINGENGNTQVWSQVLTGLNVGWIYKVKGFASSVHPDSPGKLIWDVDGTQIGSQLNLTSTVNQWEEMSATFTATSTSQTLSIINLNPAFQGNDFALDDLSIEAVPEPGTIAALGLGAIAMLRRRRKN